MVISPETLKRLQSCPDLVRNICILAHVDHGKTTLSDSLLASNGIISQNMAGKLRYLDSRSDEQMRGITMESSAISLYFKIATISSHSSPSSLSTKSVPYKEYLINLIDSPGHIDFSSEVSTASRLCDGALVLVDAVEGVLSQTVTVLRQAWVEKLKPVLVINKIDRLIIELKLTPTEAYIHLTRLIEQVNAVMGSFFSVDRMEHDLKWRERQERKKREKRTTSDSSYGEDETFVEETDDDLYFSPELNNIIFASAIDGWGFNISQFASIYERKLGMKRENLEKVLWGDYYFDPKTRKVISGNSSAAKMLRNSKPLFVQLVLENIWKVYESSIIERNPDQSAKIVNALSLKIPPTIIKGKDGKPLLSAIFNQWIPLSASVLLSVIDKIPPPTIAQHNRIPSILDNVPGGDTLDLKVRDAMFSCDPTGPIVSYISKVIAVPEEEYLRKRKQQQQYSKTSGQMISIQERARRARELATSLQQNTEISEDDKKDDSEDYDDIESYFEKINQKTKVEINERLIGFARVFSGTLKVGQKLYIIQPKFDPRFPEKHREEVTITDLFLLMGRDMIPLKEVPAGNIVGIGGLDGKILKNGTLVGIETGGPNLASSTNIGAPIVRVAIEPTDPTKLDILENGLRLLNLSDPMVQVSVAENGEHILMTAGELHLERCLKDLRERFAKVELQASKPIVPYRETIVIPKDMEQQQQSIQQITGQIITQTKKHIGVSEIRIGHVSLKLRVFPLPRLLTKYLNNNQSKIDSIINHERDHSKWAESTQIIKSDHNQEGLVKSSTHSRNQGDKLKSFKTDLSNIMTDSLKEFIDKETYDSLQSVFKLENIITFGPKRTGSNILIDGTSHSSFKHKL